MRLKIRDIAMLVALCVVATATAQPRLVVNIVVGGLRQSDLIRYEENFGKEGFARLRSEGLEFTECYADYAPTSSEAGLATIATGTLPATHGIFSPIYYDRTTNNEVSWCGKPTSSQGKSLNKDVEEGYSAQTFMAQTLSEAVLAASSSNRVITVAHNPLSAMILAGGGGECYWLNNRGKWTSAECYMKALPSWVRACNSEDINRVFATDTWYGRYTRNRYINKTTRDILVYEQGSATHSSSRRKSSESWVGGLRTMPSGNIAIMEFAKRAVSSMLPLHTDNGCKILNICLDVPRNVAERYGADSIEYEDMLYSLDATLAEFLIFLYAQVTSRNDVVVTLTSDGGVSPTQSDNSDTSRFNTRQFEVIMNAFLSARYGQDSWVLGYKNGSLYLDHNVVYNHKKNLKEVQEELAAFALQYRGVVAAVTATAMRSSQFSRGGVSLLQNGYNPRTSGDVLILLEPNRIEQDSKRVAMAGSVYNYDRHLPLIISGAGIAPQRVSKLVTNDQIAPTLAALIGVERPQCSDAQVVEVDAKK